MICHLLRDPAGIMRGFAGGAFLLIQQRPIESPRMARADMAGTATYNHMLNTVHLCNPHTWIQYCNVGLIFIFGHHLSANEVIVSETPRFCFFQRPLWVPEK